MRKWWFVLIIVGAVVSIALALRGGVWALLALILAFFVGLFVYRAQGTQSPAQPTTPTFTLCGATKEQPLTTLEATTPLTASGADHVITIAGLQIPICKGTSLDNEILASGKPDALCLTGTLNSGGLLVSGSLSRAIVGSSTLAYTGPIAQAAIAAGQQTPSLLLSGRTVPIASANSLDGTSLVSPHSAALRLDAQLNDADGSIKSGSITRLIATDASQFFWLELIYLAVLFALAVIYLYPDATPTTGLTATLTQPTSVLLKDVANAKLLTTITLLPTGISTPTPGRQHPQRLDTNTPISVNPGLIQIQPMSPVSVRSDGTISLPAGTQATFDQKLVIMYKNISGVSTTSTNKLQLGSSALATFAQKTAATALSLGKPTTSTPWDNFLLWLQDVRRWLHQVFPQPANSASNSPGFLGPIPVGIVWIGAVGSVIRGLSAATGSGEMGNYPSYYNSEYWHISRPIIGAAFALFTYLFFLSILDPSGKGSVGGQYGTYLLAFIVGYSDGTFAMLIERTINVILGPGDPHGPASGRTTSSK